MPIDFKLIEQAFFPVNSSSISQHNILIKKGKTYSVAEKTSRNTHFKKIYLGSVLNSLLNEVKKETRTDSELKKALQISNYFYFREFPHNSPFKKITDIFNRIHNQFAGNGFKTNLELAQQVRTHLIKKGIESNNLPNQIEGFKPVDFWESMSKHRKDPLSPELKSDPHMRILEANFNRFCEQLTSGPKVDLTTPPVNSPIPPTVHFIWMGTTMPDDAKDMIENTWRKIHPGWTIKIWRDADIETFPWVNRGAFEEARSAKCWAEAADVWRYEILYNEGGIYADCDMVNFRSFNELISSGATFFAGQETNKLYTDSSKPVYLNNALIGAAKGSSVIKYVIDHITPRSRSKYPKNPRKDLLSRTGPILLSDACRNALEGPEKEKVIVLPCSYIYPLPWYMDIHKDYKNNNLNKEMIRNNFVDPETLTVHLWDGKW